MIGQGKEASPTFFITANIHDNELTGIVVSEEITKIIRTLGALWKLPLSDHLQT
jgi:hypothetical protein